MSVGIITINLNQRGLVEDFIGEVEKQTFKDYHLYVVDNGSDEDQKIADEYQQLDWLTHIETGQNFGFTGGNNVGIQQALDDGHEFVWIVNNDVKLSVICLGLMVKRLEENSKVGIVAPKIYYWEEGLALSEMKKVWYAGGKINWPRPFPYTVNTHVGERAIDQGQFDSPEGDAAIETDFITGASMLIRREALEKMRFDERYFVYFEDADLSLRVQKVGYQTVYLPSAKMWHMVGAFSGITSPRSSYYQIRNSLLFVRTWAPWWSKLLAYTNLMVILGKNLVKLTIPSRQNFAKAQLGAIFDFLRGRFGGPVDIKT